MNTFQRIIPDQNEAALLAVLNHFEPRKPKLPPPMGKIASRELRDRMEAEEARILPWVAPKQRTAREIAALSGVETKMAVRVLHRLHRKGMICLRSSKRAGANNFWYVETGE